VAEAELTIIDTLDSVTPEEWQALAGDNPTLSHTFLHTLHETRCASDRTGWSPRFLTMRRAGVLVGAMPLYLKAHSRGEYESLCRDSDLHLLIDHGNLPLDKGLTALALVNQ
jgi:predicted N-acyltransferase